MSLERVLAVLLTLHMFGLCGDESTAVISSFVVSDMSQVPEKIDVGASRATVVIFTSVICPMSLDYSGRIAKLAADYGPRNVRVLVLNSNRNESSEQVEEYRKVFKLGVPVYRDPNGQVADMFHAFSTPTAVVLDRRGAVRYWGSIDNNRNPARATKQYLRQAIDALLAGKPIDLPRSRVLGCSIKSAS